MTFHQRIGNLRDHAERVARVAEAIAERVGADHEMAGEAALLAKCDLTTSLVREFPSLQGQAGGLILELQGARDEVWMAVYDQYRPLNLHSDRPQTVEGAAVALADRARRSPASSLSVKLPPVQGIRSLSVGRRSACFLFCGKRLGTSRTIPTAGLRRRTCWARGLGTCVQGPLGGGPSGTVDAAGGFRV